jgi:3-hydroxyisobutyrate dehydrogenase-like beta-hydroxyacid dehydrogenase
MDAAFAFIGFGEAGAAFAGGAPARGYDLKTGQPDLRAAKFDDFAKARVAACANAAEAIAPARAVLSLVTADQALAAARSGARAMKAGAFWFDMNSVAPDTKRAAASLIEAVAGRYVDVAVMSPVHPARRAVPLLVSGPHAETGATVLAEFGFTNVTIVEGPVGAASSIKMIRSVMVKGLEALTAECLLAAEKAGVAGEVVASLNASWPGVDWADKADYNLDRMMIHGLRRAAEMEEVVKTLDALGTGSAMTRGTVECQRAIGLLGLAPDGRLADKIDAILANGKRALPEERAA